MSSWWFSDSASWGRSSQLDGEIDPTYTRPTSPTNHRDNSSLRIRFWDRPGGCSMEESWVVPRCPRFSPQVRMGHGDFFLMGIFLVNKKRWWTFFPLKKSVCVFFCAVFGGVFRGRFKGISGLWWVGGFVCDEKNPEVKRLEGRMIFLNFTRWWFRIFFIFSPTWEDDPMWRAYFSNGMKPPTSLDKPWRFLTKLGSKTLRLLGAF